ncbi:hypothetical protein G6F35_007707 [Rhizopus arrhizus]|nr:hypothetical protein G6F35_007707 [Rhizopus arrhizus]
MAVAGPRALVGGAARDQVRQLERVYAIAAILGAQQRVQRRVLPDGNQCSVAERPVCRTVVEGEHLDFAVEGVGHDRVSAGCERKGRHAVLVRQAAAGGGDCSRIQHHCGGAVGVGDVVGFAAGRARDGGSRRYVRRGGGAGEVQWVVVRWQLRQGQGYRFGAAGLTDHALGQSQSLALVNGQATTQVGQAEGVLAIPAVGGTDQSKQGFLPGDRHKAAVAGKPANRQAAESEHADLADKRRTHLCVLLESRAERSALVPARSVARRVQSALDADEEVDDSEGLHVRVCLVAAGHAHRPAGLRHGRAGLGGIHLRVAGGAGEGGTGGVAHGAGAGHAQHPVRMRRDVADQQGDRLGAGGCAYRLRRRLPGGVHRDAGRYRHAAAQVGQGEGGAAITAILDPQQSEQGLVGLDRHQLAVAQGEAPGCKRKTGHDDLAEIDIAHRNPPWMLSAGRRTGARVL